MNLCRIILLHPLICFFFTSVLAVLGEEYIFDKDAYVQEVRSVSAMRAQISVVSQAGAMPTNTTYVVMYYAQWCPHCHHMSQAWSSLAAKFFCTPDISFLAFECSQAGDDRVAADGTLPSSYCRTQGVQGYPTLTAYWRNDTSGELVKRFIERTTQRTVSILSDWVLQNTPIKAIRPCVRPAGERAQNPGSLPNRNKPKLQHLQRWTGSKFVSSCPDRRLHDALIAISYLLRNWVAPPGVLFDEKNKQRLCDVLLIAGPLMPGRNIRDSFANLTDKLHESSNLSTEEYHSILDKTNFGGLVIPPVGNLPTLIEARQLTSALWLFFHILTVSLYERHHPNNLIINMSTLDNSSCQLPMYNGTLPINGGQFNSHSLNVVPTTPKELSNAIFTTVESFFACDVCRVHFRVAFARCAAGRCDWLNNTDLSPEAQIDVGDAYAGIVLWLWRFHNIVNFRTALEQTAEAIVSFEEITNSTSGTAYVDQNFVSYEGIDVRFPPIDLCPKCRKKTASVAPNEFMLTSELVRKAVVYEKLSRGLFVDHKSERPIESSVFDRIEDFDLHHTFDFIHAYFWRNEWRNMLVDLQWDALSRLFNISVPTTDDEAVGVPSHLLFRSGAERNIADSDIDLSPSPILSSGSSVAAILSVTSALVALILYVCVGTTALVEAGKNMLGLKSFTELKSDHMSPVTSSWSLNVTTAAVPTMSSGGVDARNRATLVYPLPFRR